MFCVLPYENNNETVVVDAFGFKTLSMIISEYKITDEQKLVYFHPGNHSVLEYGLNDCFENLGVLLPKVKDYILENFSHLTKDYYAPTPC